jgi:hypothetical protein
MRQTLRLHPDSSCLAVTHIEVEVARPCARSLVFTYAVTGSISDVAISPITAAARTDELWRHTCFEAFIGAPPDVAYYEFNFAPSTQWAAYRFSSYRAVIEEVNGYQCYWALAHPPGKADFHHPDCFVLEVV